MRLIVLPYLRLGLCCLLMVCALACSGVARADEGKTQIARIDIVGARRTKASTLLELLPRQPPAIYTAAELHEFARRASNLEIFDLLELQQKGDLLVVTVREKWTLIPEIDFSTGSSLKDTYALLGVTESNLFGTGSTLALNVYRERRGFGFAARFEEHVYRRKRWARAIETNYGSTQLSFANDTGWFATSALVCAWLTSPPVVTDKLRYEVGAIYKREWIDDVTGPTRPPNGNYTSLLMTFTWDDFHWHDLTPHGWTVYLNLSPGVFVAPDVAQPRHLAEFSAKGALRLARHTVLMGRLNSTVVVRGNANHNVSLGSVDGVRGVDDGWYYNWIQAVANVELRQAIPLAARWALQGVLFADTAGFEQMDAQGARAHADIAFSGGAGLRLIPTWLSGLMLRFDVARLVSPERRFMHQFGLTQYF